MNNKILLVALAAFSYMPLFAYRDSADLDDVNGMGCLYFLGLMVIVGIIGAIFNKK